MIALGSFFAKAGWEGQGAWSLGEWQRISGQDAKSIEGDPQFAFAPGADFRLLPGIAALEAAKRMREVSEDFHCRPTAASAVSIGAFEGPCYDWPQK